MFVRRFPECRICGQFGHTDKNCALRELNQQQEFQQKVRAQAAQVGLKPQPVKA